MHLKMHILQPKHIKLREEEALKLLAKYNITKDQLPKIKHNDPAISELDVKKGDIIKILRKSEKGETEYYRVVI